MVIPSSYFTEATAATRNVLQYTGKHGIVSVVIVSTGIAVGGSILLVAYIGTIEPVTKTGQDVQRGILDVVVMWYTFHNNRILQGSPSTTSNNLLPSAERQMHRSGQTNLRAFDLPSILQHIHIHTYLTIHLSSNQVQICRYSTIRI